MKKIYSRVSVFVVSLFSANTIALAQDQSAAAICTPLMTFASRDYVSERVDLQIAWSINDQYCDSATKTANITMNTGLDAVYKKILLQFRSSNTASVETMNEFCRTMSVKIRI